MAFRGRRAGRNRRRARADWIRATTRRRRNFYARDGDERSAGRDPQGLAARQHEKRAGWAFRRIFAWRADDYGFGEEGYSGVAVMKKAKVFGSFPGPKHEGRQRSRLVRLVCDDSNRMRMTNPNWNSAGGLRTKSDGYHKTHQQGCRDSERKPGGSRHRGNRMHCVCQMNWLRFQGS